jgi:predicted AAA+ superfamily ATPase
LANDCGITHNTAKAWISVLEASYILFQLRPHYANFSKRLIKSGQTLNRDFFTGLERWLDLAGDLAISPTLVYGGINKYIRRGINIHGWDAVSQVLETR